MTVAAPAEAAPAAAAAAAAASAVELFIYYRVPLAQAAAALAVAQDCRRRLCAAHPGLSARLLRRPEPADGHETWMETYRNEHGAGIDAALQSAIESHARPLGRFIAGPRHVERFTACA